MESGQVRCRPVFRTWWRTAQGNLCWLNAKNDAYFQRCIYDFQSALVFSFYLVSTEYVWAGRLWRMEILVHITRRLSLIIAKLVIHQMVRSILSV